MKILLFGKNGQVGWELNRSLQPLGEVVALAREDADFSNPESLRDIVHKIKPDVIVNAVAYTAVDKAEAEEELAAVINSEAPRILADEALRTNALLIHFSTDYVFDGTKDGAYTESDKPNPVNAYGRTKLSGEQALQASGCDYLIFRTSWVYASRGHNFLLTILKLAKEREELSIVADQTGSPTSARLIADSTSYVLHQAILEKRAGIFSSGLYHLTAAGCASWHAFSEEIVRMLRQKSDAKLRVAAIKEILTTDYPAPAKRPKNSLLLQTKLETKFNVKMPDWQQSLSLCIDDLIVD
jgi:dTDP-4-dehydrorhamnose reductase